jgi:hypothetical protein
MAHVVSVPATSESDWLPAMWMRQRWTGYRPFKWPNVTRWLEADVTSEPPPYGPKPENHREVEGGRAI